MWTADDAVSNGACSDPVTSPVNGTAQCDHNSTSAPASCLVSHSSESCPAYCVSSKFANEKATSLKCVVCHNASAEASDISVQRGAALSPADSIAGPPTAASLNCNSVTRTSRHVYSDCVTDDDGYFISNTDRNTLSAADVDTVPVCESAGSEFFSTNGTGLRSRFPQAAVSITVNSDGHVNDNSARPLNGDRCLACEQDLVCAEASSSSTANTDLTESLTTDLAVADLCDDGYMDEIDIVSTSIVDMHQHGHTAAWLVESDTCLDDFIDADMPHSAAVAGSPSSSSLSSTHDEPNRMPDNRSSNPVDITDEVIGVLDVSVNTQQQALGYLQQNSHTEEHGTVARSCPGSSHNDWVNGLHNQLAPHTTASQTQPSHSDRCLQSESEIAHSCHGMNVQVQSSNPASESSHDTPPASLPSPSDDYYVNGEPPAAAFFAAVADEQVFEESTAAASCARARKPSDSVETHGSASSLKQNQCYWLPIGPESDSSPKFGCWSCVEVMSNASSSLSAGYVATGKSRLRDGSDDGVMWRSSPGDYTSHDYSDLLTDNICENSPLSSRMSSSLTL